MSAQYQMLSPSNQQYDAEMSLAQEKIAGEKSVLHSQTPDDTRFSTETLRKDLSKMGNENILPAPMPGRELIDRIDALGFTQQDQDEMTKAIQEGRKITYEDWSKTLFD